MNLRTTVSLSVLLHALLVGAWVWLRDRVDIPQPPVFREVTLSAPVKKQAPHRSKSSRPSKGALGDSLARVLPKGGLFGLRGGQQPGSAQAQGDGYAFAEGMDIASETEHYPFFDRLWRKIDVGLGYPSDLVEANIESDFTIQIEVDRRGVFTGRFVDLPANPSLLVVYSAAWLARSLREPLPPSLWAREERITLVTRFNFKLFHFTESFEGRGGGSFKNVFEFARAAYTPPQAMKAITRFYDQYVPPVLPVPGGVVIDVVRVYRMIQEWGKADRYERHDRRLRILKEKWEGTVYPQ